MAAFNFPNSPSTNDLHTENGVTFKWNGTIWLRIANSYSDVSTLNVSGIGTFGGHVYISEYIIHSGDTNTWFRFPSNDNITFGTAGSERVRIDSSGLVAIGHDSPSSFSSGANNLVVKDAAGAGGITIVTPNNAMGSIFFADSTSATGQGRIRYDHNGDYMTLNTNASERLRILSDGKVGINRTAPAEALEVGGSVALIGGSLKLDTHPLVTTAGFTAISGGSYAARLGSTGSSTIRSTQIYGGGNHIATFDGVNNRLGVNQTAPNSMIEATLAGECQMRLGYNQSKYVQIGRAGAGNYQFLSQEQGSKLEFGTATSADGAGVIHMTMNRYGGVGIRTDKSTSYGFCIAGNSAALGAGNLTDSGGLILQPRDAFFATGRTYPAILWSGNTNNLERARAGITAVSMNSNDASSIIFMTRHAANGTALTSDDERMRIADDGVVQVGKDNQSSTTYTQSMYIRGRYVNAEGDFAKLLFRNSTDSGSCSAGIRGRRDAASNYATGLTFHTNQGNNNTTDSGQGRKTMHISSEGWVTMPYQSCFQAHSNGASHLDIPGNAGNDYVFTTESFDNHNDYNTSNGRFTAPVAGKYVFGIQIYAGFSISGVRVHHARFKKNGGDEYGTDIFGGASNHGGTSYHPTGTGSVMYDLAANDYVTWNIGTFAGSGSGSTQIYGSKSTRFWGYLVA